MANKALPTVEEFKRLVENTNNALGRIGVPEIKFSDIELTNGGYSYYHSAEGLIELSVKGGKPVLGHEGYHKHARDNVLTTDELAVLNNLRRDLVNKIREEVIARHAIVSEDLRKRNYSQEELQENLMELANVGYPLSLDSDYIIPCRRGCAGKVGKVAQSGLHNETQDKKFPVTIHAPAHYILDGDKWIQVPDIKLLVDLTHFSDLFSPEERYFIGQVGYAPAYLQFCPKKVTIDRVRNRELVAVVDKFASRGSVLSCGGAGADEAPAYLIKAWLEGRDMEDYSSLRKYVKDGTYRSGSFGRGSYEERLADLIIGSYERSRMSGCSVEDAIAQTIDIQNFLRMVRR